MTVANQIFQFLKGILMMITGVILWRFGRILIPLGVAYCAWVVLKIFRLILFSF